MKKILIVGAGGIGERHIRCFLATGRSRVWACDVDEEKLKRLSETYLLGGVFTKFSEIELKNFDGVVIAVPAHMHIQMASKCAESDVPFLVEKPLSVDYNGVDELISMINTRKLTSGVAYVRRSIPLFKRFRDLSRYGIIGNLRMGRFNCSQDYRKYRPDYQRTYYARTATGGGCISNVASHFINLTQWIFGEVKHVCSFYDRLEFQGVEAEDTSIILMRFTEENALVEIFLNQFQKPNISEFELIGTTGNLRYIIEGETHRITLCRSDDNIWEEVVSAQYTRDDPFIAQSNNFINALEGKDTLPTSIEEGKKTMDVVLTAKEFQERKGYIVLPSDSNR